MAAEDDYTCYDNTLADDFKKMMVQKRVSAVHDYRIFNLAVRYGKSNPHSSVGYYIHPRLAKVISDWIGLPVSSPGTPSGSDN
jgi:trehalose-6-phosphate synthase